MKKIGLLVTSLLFVPVINGMESDGAGQPKLQVYAIPGQNGLCSEPGYVEALLGRDQVAIRRVETPEIIPDLGQWACIRHLRNALSRDRAENVVIHAASQGTATALNYLAEDQGRRIKGLILEAVLASGNSAIMHTLNGPLMNLPGVARLPLSYYWVPYAAKILMPFFSPSGRQPIKSVSKLPNDIPIILVHSKDDPQLSYNDACALYYSLRANGNNNVYLISREGERHIDIFAPDYDGADIVQNILKRHGLLPGHEEMELGMYQPDPQQYKPLYDELIGRERNHVRIRNVGCAVAAGIVLRMIMKRRGPAVRCLTSS